MAVKIECGCHYCINDKPHSHKVRRNMWNKNQDYIYNRLHIPEKDFIVLKAHRTELRICKICFHVE